MTLAEITAVLAGCGRGSPAYDAARLVERFYGADAVRLRMEPEHDYTAAGLDEAVARRAAREPLQYILGEWGFWRETYRVAPGCLIPRADTELLVEYAVKRLPQGGRLLDLCTGSGCIAVSTLASRPECTGDAVDVYDVPLALAAENAARNGVDGRLTVRRGDVLCGEGAEGTYACICSNPPYVVREVLPALAPEPGLRTGVGAGRRRGRTLFLPCNLDPLRANLATGGCFIFEIGYDQAEALRALACEAGWPVPSTAIWAAVTNGRY